MNWPTLEVSEITSTQYGYTASATEEPVGPKFLRITDIVPSSIDWSSVPFCQIDERNHERCLLRAGDIVVARTGATTGYAKLIRSDQDAVFASYLVRFRVHDDRVDERFLGLVMESPSYKSFIKSTMGGAAQPNANAKTLARFPLPLPSRRVQEEIISVICAYDDLIENNRRRIALLEQAARLLYREWFVHFRFPGHEHAKTIDGLPEGWERRALGELAEVRLGKMLDEKKNRGDLRPYLANVNVRWGTFDLAELRTMRFEHSDLEKYGLMHGDIVMCEGGEPGRCAIWKDQVPGMMLQKALHRIRSRARLDNHFLYYCLSFMAKSGRLAGLFTGATIKHLPLEKLLTVRIEMPPERLVREFADFVAPIEAQLRTLEMAIWRASEARDLLLPRLMNGEIAV